MPETSVSVDTFLYAGSFGFCGHQRVTHITFSDVHSFSAIVRREQRVGIHSPLRTCAKETEMMKKKL